MLLPVVALAALGVSRYHPPGRTDLYVEEIKLEPVTPSEVEAGFSYKVAVVLNHPWPKPAWWGPSAVGSLTFIDPLQDAGTTHEARPSYWRIGGGLIYQKAGRPQRFLGHDHLGGVQYYTTSYENGRLVMHWLLALHQVPDQLGAITFLAAMGRDFMPAQSASLIVRQAGQHRGIPAVDKRCPLSLTHLSVEPYGSPLDADVKVGLKYAGAMPNGPDGLQWQWGHWYVVDVKDKHYTWVPGTTGGVGWGMFDYDAAKGEFKTHFFVPRTQMPSVPGPVTVKQKLSVNGCWPLTISAVVRPY
ncbi:MAG: hypothetical protein JO316_17240 [Abitibacteriaceae bacterium]|nr:hypothetical protein [Abditibacteriaceae bacterium]MBV9867102.1 hypothetical protein [Abditibacteriaceae bacterium]